MKKKLLAILLSLVAVVAFAGVAVTASAAGTKDAVTVKNANFATDWNMVLFETDTPSGATEPWGTADPSHITVIAPDGSILAPNAVHLNNYIYIGVNNNTEPAVGTTFTIHAGYAYTANSEVKEDITWKYSTQGATFTKVEPTGAVESVAVAGELTVQAGATVLDLSALRGKATYADGEVATVDATGKVLGVKEGTATITAKAGDLSETYEVEVLPELEMKGLEFATSYKIYVEKGGKLALPSDFTAHAVFDNDGKDVYGSDFKLNEENCTLSDVDTATVGTKVSKATVSFAGKQYTLDVSVEVYEVIPMDIKEVAVVEWFSYSIFVQYPDSTVNVANITDATCIPDATKYVYTRADGTEVKCGTYNLGGGNVAILPTFYDGKQDADNWNKAPYMQEGDRITLKAGFSGYMWTGELAPTETDNAAMKAGTGMIVPECRLAEEVTFVFDGMVWGIYIPYTDLKVNETATVQVGDTVSLGAVRVPDTATEGNFYYKSSDESIVTVNNNGRITGVKQGTATVTVTLKDGVAGEKTKTVTVTVTDGIVGLEFAEGTVLTVKKGTEKLDLSGLTANLVWASGKTEKADLSKAEIVGYDKDAAGESEVTVKVTVDGKTYQAQLTVRVQRGGCGSVAEAGASVFAGAVIALSAAALVVGFRKKAKK